MPLGPFEAVNNRIRYKGNKIFSSIEDVQNISAPDLSKRHLELKANSEKWKHLIIIYNSLRIATENFMRKDNALFLDLPITTRMISSPGSLSGTIPSDVHPFKINMFGNETFLTQSSQLYLEFAITTDGVDKVYCFDKSFRKERADFRHLPEFTHIEYEANIGFIENLHVQEAYIKFIVEYLLRNCLESMKFFLSDDDIEELTSFLGLNIETISFHDAFRLLRKATDNRKYDNVTIKNFGAYEEILLTQILGNKPVFITHFIADEVAFYHALDKNNKNLVVNADLLFPGYGELIGSGERVHTREDTEKKAKHFQLNIEDYKAYIESRDPKNPKVHSGWGMGVERFLQAILKLPFIWESKAFPRLDNSVRP
jgi:asparaginyl-tRNA synthetase